MIAILFKNNYYAGYNETITAEELDNLGYQYVFVAAVPNEILTAGNDKMVRVTSIQPFQFVLEDIPAPADPPKTPEQERLDLVELNNADLMMELAETNIKLTQTEQALAELMLLVAAGGV